MYWQSYFSNCVSWTRQWGWNPSWIRVYVALTQFPAKPRRLSQNSERICFAAFWNVWLNGLSLRFFNLLSLVWFYPTSQSFPCDSVTWRRRKGLVGPVWSFPHVTVPDEEGRLEECAIDCCSNLVILLLSETLPG